MSPRSHHARKVPLEVLGEDPAGVFQGPDPDAPSIDAVAWLLEMEAAMPLAPELARAHRVTCHGCGRTIHAGDTLFASTRIPRFGRLFCYTCGTSLMVFFGVYTNTEAMAIPPIGGPAPTPKQRGGRH